MMYGQGLIDSVQRKVIEGKMQETIGFINQGKHVEAEMKKRLSVVCSSQHNTACTDGGPETKSNTNMRTKWAVAYTARVVHDEY